MHHCENCVVDCWYAVVELLSLSRPIMAVSSASLLYVVMGAGLLQSFVWRVHRNGLRTQP